MDCRSELSQSPIKIPERFHQVLYNYDRYPGAPGVRGLVGGANCQQYAYEFLRARARFQSRAMFCLGFAATARSSQSPLQRGHGPRFRAVLVSRGHALKAGSGDLPRGS
jgi:hypothetical protein